MLFCEFKNLFENSGFASKLSNAIIDRYFYYAVTVNDLSVAELEELLNFILDSVARLPPPSEFNLIIKTRFGRKKEKRKCQFCNGDGDFQAYELKTGRFMAFQCHRKCDTKSDLIPVWGKRFEKDYVPEWEWRKYPEVFLADGPPVYEWSMGKENEI